jgi:predicted RNA binding protein YcfA (HicA-like mRNA interferase family)
MSKLPVISSKKLAKFLEKLGFRQDHVTGSHFIFYNSKTNKRAVVPRHTKDLPKGTLLSILREAGVVKEEIEKASKNK